MKLYVVPTPIGNLKDITLRALDVLNDVDIILAEDTRTSKVLLNHYQINKPLWSYHQHNEHFILVKIINEILDLNAKYEYYRSYSPDDCGPISAASCCFVSGSCIR